MKVFDFCYNFVPKDAQKDFRRIMYDLDNGRVAFMDAEHSVSLMERMRQDAIEQSQEG